MCKKLDTFSCGADESDEWLLQKIDTLESRELARLDLEDYNRKVDELQQEQNVKEVEFQNLIKLGKNLISLYMFLLYFCPLKTVILA